ncbi:MAG: hypothetical protein ABI868_13000 [Acidobacteriota bacterium]
MNWRVRRFTGVLLAVAIVVLEASGFHPAAAAQSAPGARAARPDARKSWTPPRTPWGDPDVSGYFTNKDEQNVPFERPAEFAGRQTITDEEFAAREERLRQQLRTDNAEFDPATADIRNAGAVGSPTSPPPHWLDRPKPSRRTSMIVDPADGRIPPQTPEGQKRTAERAAAREQARGGRGPADSYIDRSLYDRCITRGLPGSMMPAIYGNAYQIVQGPGWVGIRYEMIHEIRVIPLETRPHVSPRIRSYMGDARGRWDGNTLVVETTNFRDDAAYRGANPEAVRLIERFTRVAADQVEWSVTIDDPTTWARPWTFAMNLTQDDTQPVFEYACHEGNYAMFNILTGARAEEKAGRAVTGGGDEGER